MRRLFLGSPRRFFQNTLSTPLRAKAESLELSASSCGGKANWLLCGLDPVEQRDMVQRSERQAVILVMILIGKALRHVPTPTKAQTSGPAVSMARLFVTRIELIGGHMAPHTESHIAGNMNGVWWGR